MISTIVDSKDEPKEKPFPKLMIFTEAEGVLARGLVKIVLFQLPKRGVCVYSTSTHQIGDFYDLWNMDRFRDFHGTIQLRNE